MSQFGLKQFAFRQFTSVAVWSILSGLTLNSALAQNSGIGLGPVPIGPVQGCAIPRIDGDKVPFPLKSANTKFELAEDETYLLNGYLLQQERGWAFKIDFQSQPWLATQYRSQFPVFPVDVNASDLLQWTPGQMVQMAVVVRKSTPTSGNASGDQEFTNNFRLESLLPPVKVLP